MSGKKIPNQGKTKSKETQKFIVNNSKSGSDAGSFTHEIMVINKNIPVKYTIDFIVFIIISI